MPSPYSPGRGSGTRLASGLASGARNVLIVLGCLPKTFSSCVNHHTSVRHTAQWAVGLVSQLLQSCLGRPVCLCSTWRRTVSGCTQRAGSV